MYGDLANFMLPGKVKGIASAMDLATNPNKTKLIVTMEHVDKKGRPKILKVCTFPLTGQWCVSKIITDLAVFDVDFVKGLALVEIAEGSGIEEIRSKTEVGFEVADKVDIDEWSMTVINRSAELMSGKIRSGFARYYVDIT